MMYSRSYWFGTTALNWRFVSLCRSFATLLFLSYSTSAAQQTIDSSVIFLFGGDVTFSNRVAQHVGNNLEYVFQHWNEIGQFDMMMVNLESPVTFLTDSVEKEYVYRMHLKYLRSLKNAGIGVVTCGNNHMADFGRKGILETLNFLDSAGICYTGAGKNIQEARTPIVFNFQGIKIGLLGYGGSGKDHAASALAGTTPRNESMILEDVRKAKLTMDFLVVNLHWGEERSEEPSQAQRTLAHRIINAGANLIIGHHSHTLQAVEEYKNGVIAYSLGNFVFGGNIAWSNGLTAVMKATFTREGMKHELVPVELINWQPRPAQGKKKEQVLKLVAERTQALKKMK
ncbi:MAG: CapA family protein [bacterium]